MNISKLYIRACVAFSALEALPSLYGAWRVFTATELIAKPIVIFAFYSAVLLLSYRILRKEDLAAAKSLLTLRVGLVAATLGQFWLITPTPPITILFGRLLLPAFQLYLARKAFSAIKKEQYETS